MEKFKNNKIKEQIMGIYMGRRAMAGEQGRDIRNLAAEIEAQQKAYDEGMKERGKWGLFGDLLSFVLPPGWGQAADLAVSQIAQHNIDVGDPSKIAAKETMWTKGLGERMGEEFGEMVDESETSLLEGIIGGVMDYGMGEALSKIGGKAKEGFSKVFGGKDAKEVFDPLIDTAEPYPDMGEKFIPGQTPKSEFNPLAIKSDYLNYEYDYEQGGQVPSQEQLMQLLAMIQQQQAPAQQQKPTTIADYFLTQGKSLGGNNKQSLREMLGR